MTESWAVGELTEEQEAEVVKEQEEATEDKPAQLNPDTQEDPDDPPQIDRRSISERLGMDEEKPTEDKSEPDKKTEATDTTKEEIKSKETASEDVKDQKEIKRPAFWADLPKEAQEYIDNLAGARKEARENKREMNEEFNRRFKLYDESLKTQLTEAVKSTQPKEPEPDPDIEPEKFRDYHTNRTTEAEKIADEALKLEVEVKGSNELLGWMADQEADDPDFMPAFNHLKETLVARELEKGRSEEAANQEVYKIARAHGARLKEEGGSWTTFVKFYAKEAGWGVEQKQENTTTTEKPNGSGKETAEAIVAGEKAAKGLTGGGGENMGDLTLEQIWNIEDPDEHDKAYDNYLRKQLGKNQDWMP